MVALPQEHLSHLPHRGSTVDWGGQPTVGSNQVGQGTHVCEVWVREQDGIDAVDLPTGGVFSVQTQMRSGWASFEQHELF